jgi:hypothetical protein
VAVVGDRPVLPYWTEPHGNLSLELRPRGKRLGLGRVQLGDVSVSDERFRVLLPVHVTGDTDVRLRFVSSRRILEVPGTLSPEADRPGSVLAADLPAEDLSGDVWRVAVCLNPHSDQARFTGLPFALRAGGGSVLVTPVPGPGVALRLARRARRVLGAARRKVNSRIRTGGR